MTVTCIIKIHDVLFLKKWQPWKGPVLAEIVELFLPGSCSAFYGPASSQCLASLAQSAYVSVGVRFCRTIRARNLQKAASLSSWLFTCHSMRHSECCKVMSESVVSVTIQLTSQVLHLQLVNQLQWTAWCHTCCKCSWSNSPSNAWCRADVSRHWRRQNPHQWVAMLEYIRITIQLN